MVDRGPTQGSTTILGEGLGQAAVTKLLGHPIRRLCRSDNFIFYGSIRDSVITYASRSLTTTSHTSIESCAPSNIGL